MTIQEIRDAYGKPDAGAYEIAHFLNTTVEDLMCATGSWKVELINRANIARASREALPGYEQLAPRQGPRCPNCDKPIPKLTHTVNAPREPGRFIPVKGWTYTGNLEVVSQRYALVSEDGYLMKRPGNKLGPHDRGEQRLEQVSTWDGESYDPRGGYFCRDRCAEEFGEAAYAAGFRRKS